MVTAGKYQKLNWLPFTKIAPQGTKNKKNATRIGESYGTRLYVVFSQCQWLRSVCSHVLLLNYHVHRPLRKCCSHSSFAEVQHWMRTIDVVCHLWSDYAIVIWLQKLSHLSHLSPPRYSKWCRMCANNDECIISFGTFWIECESAELQLIGGGEWQFPTYLYGRLLLLLLCIITILMRE